MERDHLGEHQHSDKRGLTRPPTNLSHTRCNRVFAGDPIELLTEIFCNQITEKMIVDDGVGHVVARSGSSDRSATKAACSSRLTRSPRRCLASPAGTVSTPNPRSTTSTGPPWSRCQRRRTAAGRDICPDAETKNCCTASMRDIVFGIGPRGAKLLLRHSTIYRDGSNWMMNMTAGCPAWPSRQGPGRHLQPLPRHGHPARHRRRVGWADPAGYLTVHSIDGLCAS